MQHRNLFKFIFGHTSELTQNTQNPTFVTYCMFQINKKTNKHEDHVESENLPHDGYGALTCCKVFETSDSGVPIHKLNQQHSDKSLTHEWAFWMGTKQTGLKEAISKNWACTISGSGFAVWLDVHCKGSRLSYYHCIPSWVHTVPISAIRYTSVQNI